MKESIVGTIEGPNIRVWAECSEGLRQQIRGLGLRQKAVCVGEKIFPAIEDCVQWRRHNKTGKRPRRITVVIGRFTQGRFIMTVGALGAFSYLIILSAMIVGKKNFSVAPQCGFRLSLWTWHPTALDIRPSSSPVILSVEAPATIEVIKRSEDQLSDQRRMEYELERAIYAEQTRQRQEAISKGMSEAEIASRINLCTFYDWGKINQIIEDCHTKMPSAPDVYHVTTSPPAGGIILDGERVYGVNVLGYNLPSTHTRSLLYIVENGKTVYLEFLGGKEEYVSGQQFIIPMYRRIGEQPPTE